MDTVDAVAAHRPYGLDCKCGRAINSDADWAQHLIDALGLTEEPAPPEWVEGDPAVKCACGSGNLRGRWVAMTRLVSAPWVRKDNTNE